MEQFSENDNAYREWIRANPNGYVLNTYRNPPPSYAKLHKVGYHNIQNYLHVNPTADYTKWCSLTKQELVEQARQFGATPDEPTCCF